MMSVFFILLPAFRQPQRFQNAAARARANINKTDDISPGLAFFAVASHVIKTRFVMLFLGFVLSERAG